MAWWNVDWGDGTFDSYPAYNHPAVHAYPDAGSYLIQITAVLLGGSTHVAPAQLAVVSPDSATVDLSVVAPSPDTSYALTADGDGDAVLTTADGTAVGTYPTDSLASVSVTGDPAGDLTLDRTNVDPLPPAGLACDGGTPIPPTGPRRA